MQFSKAKEGIGGGDTCTFRIFEMFVCGLHFEQRGAFSFEFDTILWKEPAQQHHKLSRLPVSFFPVKKDPVKDQRRRPLETIFPSIVRACVSSFSCAVCACVRCSSDTVYPQMRSFSRTVRRLRFLSNRRRFRMHTHLDVVLELQPLDLEVLLERLPQRPLLPELCRVLLVFLLVHLHLLLGAP